MNMHVQYDVYYSNSDCEEILITQVFSAARQGGGIYHGEILSAAYFVSVPQFLLPQS